MCKIFVDDCGVQYIKARVTFDLEIEIDDDFLQINRKTAVGLVQNQLDYLAESNDGSEILANIPDVDISIEGDNRE